MRKSRVPRLSSCPTEQQSADVQQGNVRKRISAGKLTQHSYQRTPLPGRLIPSEP